MAPGVPALPAAHEGLRYPARWDPALLHGQAALERLGVPSDHALLAARMAQQPRERRTNLKPLAARFLRAVPESPSPS